MKLVITIKRVDDAPSDWRLEVLEKINKFMQTLVVKDFHIMINEIHPYVVDWSDP